LIEFKNRDVICRSQVPFGLGSLRLRWLTIISPMKKLYYTGLIMFALFEIANVYFIMPMPGSQRLDTVELAYFLYANRWIFRILCVVLITLGAIFAFRTKRKWIPGASALPVLIVIYILNFRMTADRMFLQPKNLVFKSKRENILTDSSLVVSVNHQGVAKAYPIRLIQYHHQVRDTIAGKAIMVTYCNVCRTGRVFEPAVDGAPEEFRLVGMDHFNAMFEDKTTKSWWRQASGEAVTGPLKGKFLKEVKADHLTLNKFFSLYPFGMAMQPDLILKENYDTLGRFEKGKSDNDLIKTDSLSWKDKSWVVGVVIDNHARAYDWNDLKNKRVIHDVLAGAPIVIVIASDDQSIAAFERHVSEEFAIRNDSIFSQRMDYDFAGRNASGPSLKPVPAYQEFWHSWKQFHPNTDTYRANK